MSSIRRCRPFSFQSPAEERAVGDGAFCFLGRRNRSYGVVRGSWYRWRAGRFNRDLFSYLNRRQARIGKGAADECLFFLVRNRKEKGLNVELTWLATSIAKER